MPNPSLRLKYATQDERVRIVVAVEIVGGVSTDDAAYIREFLSISAEQASKRAALPATEPTP